MTCCICLLRDRDSGGVPRGAERAFPLDAVVTPLPASECIDQRAMTYFLPLSAPRRSFRVAGCYANVRFLPRHPPKPASVFAASLTPNPRSRLGSHDDYRHFNFPPGALRSCQETATLHMRAAGETGPRRTDTEPVPGILRPYSRSNARQRRQWTRRLLLLGPNASCPGSAGLDGHRPASPVDERSVRPIVRGRPAARDVNRASSGHEPPGRTLHA